jgi:hypothetical protein
MAAFQEQHNHLQKQGTKKKEKKNNNKHTTRTTIFKMTS